MTYTVEQNGEILVTTLRQPDEKWLDTPSAARILSVTENSFFHTFLPSNNYHEVRRVLRGSGGKQSARGQGNLFHINDLTEIRRIRKMMASKVGVAARVFAAQKKGLI